MVLQLFSRKLRNTLHMPRTREHIYRYQLAADGDAALLQHCKVTREGLRIAGHIDERAGGCCKLCESVDE